MAEFVGKYEYESDDGKFDSFLQAMNVGIMVRTAAKATKPSIHVDFADGQFTVSTVSTFKNTTIKFKLDEEFDENRMDGKTVKTIFTRDGNKLIQKQAGDPPVEIIREFSGDKLVTTCKCKDVVCVRNYKKKE